MVDGDDGGANDKPDQPYLYLGVGLLALANVFDEFAVVNYNAMLPGIAGREHIGRVSGQGWAMGYFGGIVALTIVLFGFITPGLLGIPEEDALNVRAVALFSGLWIALFSIPVLLVVPEIRPTRRGPEEISLKVKVAARPKGADIMRLGYHLSLRGTLSAT